MMYNIIGTGSKGNAVMIGEHIMIDCGLPYKKLDTFARDLRLILLTHRHVDHFNKKTVKRMAADHPLIRWGCCQWMLPLLLDAGVAPDRIDLIAPGQQMEYPNLARIKPEEVMHDVPNCCWHLDINGYKIFYVTDAGHLEGITAKAYNLYMIEANHTQEDIQRRQKEKEARGEYAYEVRAAANHLSFEQATDWLVNNAEAWADIVYLHQHTEKGELLC